MKPKTPADADSIRRFFADRPYAQSIFEDLTGRLDACGPMQLVSTKSRVAYLAKTRFAWIHEATEEGLWLAFNSDGLIPSPRLRSGQKGKRWSHHLKLRAVADNEVMAWLKKGYAEDVA